MPIPRAPSTETPTLLNKSVVVQRTTSVPKQKIMKTSDFTKNIK